MKLSELLNLLKTAETVEEMDVRREEIAALIPAVRTMFGYDQKNSAHQYDLWMHSLHVVCNLPRRMENDMVYLAALLHDIGKIGIPDNIINKPGKLTDEEFKVIKGHTLTGAKILSEIKSAPELIYGAKYHHERYDGSGDPDGLKGDEIPLCAQIVGLVDAYDALVSVRPYKRKLKHEEAIRMIANGECGVFSKKLLQCFIAAAMQKEWIKKADS